MIDISKIREGVKKLIEPLNIALASEFATSDEQERAIIDDDSYEVAEEILKFLAGEGLGFYIKYSDVHTPSKSVLNVRWEFKSLKDLM